MISGNGPCAIKVMVPRLSHHFELYIPHTLQPYEVKKKYYQENRGDQLIIMVDAD